MCETDDFADVGYCVEVGSARMKERPGAFCLPSCRSAEMAEEQNYNMIDGRINNLLLKKENPEVPKKRKSVLLRLYKHRCEVAKKQGKPMPRRYQGMEMERNRK